MFDKFLNTHTTMRSLLLASVSAAAIGCAGGSKSQSLFEEEGIPPIPRSIETILAQNSGPFGENGYELMDLVDYSRKYTSHPLPMTQWTMNKKVVFRSDPDKSCVLILERVKGGYQLDDVSFRDNLNANPEQGVRELMAYLSLLVGQGPKLEKIRQDLAGTELEIPSFTDQELANYRWQFAYFERKQSTRLQEAAPGAKQFILDAQFNESQAIGHVLIMACPDDNAGNTKKYWDKSSIGEFKQKLEMLGADVMLVGDGVNELSRLDIAKAVSAQTSPFTSIIIGHGDPDRGLVIGSGRIARLARNTDKTDMYLSGRELGELLSVNSRHNRCDVFTIQCSGGKFLGELSQTLPEGSVAVVLSEGRDKVRASAFEQFLTTISQGNFKGDFSAPQLLKDYMLTGDINSGLVWDMAPYVGLPPLMDMPQMAIAGSGVVNFQEMLVNQANGYGVDPTQVDVKQTANRLGIEEEKVEHIIGILKTANNHGDLWHAAKDDLPLLAPMAWVVYSNLPAVEVSPPTAFMDRIQRDGTKPPLGR